MLNLSTSTGIIAASSSLSWFPQASLWTEQVTLMMAEKGHAGKQASTSTPAIKESNQQRAKSTDKRENSLNGKHLA